jgi:hypothetical protein
LGVEGTRHERDLNGRLIYIIFHLQFLASST